MNLATVGTAGEIVLSGEIRQQLQIGELVRIVVRDGQMVITPIRHLRCVENRSRGEGERREEGI